jgi:hypothetical protein
MSKERIISRALVLMQLQQLTFEQLDGQIKHSYKQHHNNFMNATERELIRLERIINSNVDEQEARDGLAAQNELTLMIDYIMDVIFGQKENKDLLTAIQNNINGKD